MDLSLGGSGAHPIYAYVVLFASGAGLVGLAALSYFRSRFEPRSSSHRQRSNFPAEAEFEIYPHTMAAQWRDQSAQVEIEHSGGNAQSPTNEGPASRSTTAAAAASPSRARTSSGRTASAKTARPRQRKPASSTDS